MPWQTLGVLVLTARLSSGSKSSEQKHICGTCKHVHEILSSVEIRLICTGSIPLDLYLILGACVTAVTLNTSVPIKVWPAEVQKHGVRGHSAVFGFQYFCFMWSTGWTLQDRTRRGATAAFTAKTGNRQRATGSKRCCARCCWEKLHLSVWRHWHFCI